jgi:hypothetical protein
MAKLRRYPLARIDADAVRAWAAEWIAGLWAQEKVTTATTWDKEAVMIGSRRAGHIGYCSSEPGPGQLRGDFERWHHEPRAADDCARMAA